MQRGRFQVAGSTSGQSVPQGGLRGAGRKEQSTAGKSGEINGENVCDRLLSPSTTGKKDGSRVRSDAAGDPASCREGNVSVLQHVVNELPVPIPSDEEKAQNTRNEEEAAALQNVIAQREWRINKAVEAARKERIIIPPHGDCGPCSLTRLRMLGGGNYQGRREEEAKEKYRGRVADTIKGLDLTRDQRGEVLDDPGFVAYIKTTGAAMVSLGSMGMSALANKFAEYIRTPGAFFNGVAFHAAAQMDGIAFSVYSEKRGNLELFKTFGQRDNSTGGEKEGYSILHIPGGRSGTIKIADHFDLLKNLESVSNIGGKKKSVLHKPTAPLTPTVQQNGSMKERGKKMSVPVPVSVAKPTGPSPTPPQLRGPMTRSRSSPSEKRSDTDCTSSTQSDEEAKDEQEGGGGSEADEQTNCMKAASPTGKIINAREKSPPSERRSHIGTSPQTREKGKVGNGKRATRRHDSPEVNEAGEPPKKSKTKNGAATQAIERPGNKGEPVQTNMGEDEEQELSGRRKEGGGAGKGPENEGPEADELGESGGVSPRNCSLTAPDPGVPSTKFCSTPIFSAQEKAHTKTLFALHAIVASAAKMFVRIPVGLGPGVRGTGKGVTVGDWNEYGQAITTALDSIIVASIKASGQTVRFGVGEIMSRENAGERADGIKTLKDLFLHRVTNIFGENGSFSNDRVINSKGLDSWYTAAMLLNVKDPLKNMFDLWVELRSDIGTGELRNPLEKRRFKNFVGTFKDAKFHDANNPSHPLFDPTGVAVADSKIITMTQFELRALSVLFEANGVWFSRTSAQNDVYNRVWGVPLHGEPRDLNCMVYRSPKNFWSRTVSRVTFEPAGAQDCVVVALSSVGWKAIDLAPRDVVFVVQSAPRPPREAPETLNGDGGDDQWHPGSLKSLESPSFQECQQESDFGNSSDMFRQFGRLSWDQTVKAKVAFIIHTDFGVHANHFREAAAVCFGRLKECMESTPSNLDPDQLARRLANAEFAVCVLPVLLGRRMPGKNSDNKMSRSRSVPAIARRTGWFRDGDFKALIDEYLHDFDITMQADRPVSEGAEEEQKVKRFFQLVQSGQSSRARKLIESSGVADMSHPEVLLILAESYQTRESENELPDDELDELPDLSGIARVEIGNKTVTDILEGLRKFKAHCFWSGETLATLKPTESTSDLGKTIISLLANFCEYYANGELSPQLTYMLEIGRCVGLHKTAHSASAEKTETWEELRLRNITCGDPLKQLAETAAFAEPFKGIGERTFHPVQVGVATPNGCALFPKAVELHLAAHPDHMALGLDAVCAYGSIFQKHVLLAVLRDPELRSRYKCTYKKFATKAPILIQLGGRMRQLGSTRSEEGMQMGANSSGVLFCRTIHDDLVLSHEVVSEFGGMVLAGMDDIVMCGPPDVVIPEFRKLKQRLSLIGVNFNASKCSAYIAKEHRTVEFAALLTSVKIGVSEVVNGKIAHSSLKDYAGMERDGNDNDDEAVADLQTTDSQKKQVAVRMAKLMAKRQWGLKIFGVPVGDDAYIVKNLQEKTDSLLDEDQALIIFVKLAQNPLYGALPWKHSFWSIAKHCLNRKTEFWLRCVRPDLVLKSGIIPAADSMIVAWWARIGDLPGMQSDAYFNSEHIDNPNWFSLDPTVATITAMCRQPASYGGFGFTANKTIHNACALSGFAEVASMAINRRTVLPDGTIVEVKGLFPSLESMFGAGSFDFDHADKMKVFFEFAKSKRKSHRKLRTLATEIGNAYRETRRLINPDTTDASKGLFSLGWELSSRKFPDNVETPEIPQLQLQKSITEAIHQASAKHIHALVQTNIISTQGRTVKGSVAEAYQDNVRFADASDCVNAAFNSFPTKSSSLSDAQFQLALAQRLGLATRHTSSAVGLWVGSDGKEEQIRDDMGWEAISKRKNLQNGWTQPHDRIASTLEEIAKDAGLKASQRGLRDALFGGIVSNFVLATVAKEADKEVEKGHQPSKCRRGVTPDIIIDFPPSLDGNESKVVIDVKRISPGTQSYYPADGSYRADKKDPPVERRASKVVEEYSSSLAFVDATHCGTPVNAVGPFQGALKSAGGIIPFVVGRCGEVNTAGRAILNSIVNAAAAAMFRNGRSKTLAAGKICSRRFYYRAMGISILKAQADCIIQAISLCAPTKEEAAERWDVSKSGARKLSRSGSCQAVVDPFRYAMFARPIGERTHAVW